MSEDLIIEEIEEHREEYIEFLRSLIKTDSYNPPGNEKNVALKIEEYLNEVGIKSEIFAFGENRANLMTTLNNQFEGKTLLYNGHMDVVPSGSIEEWKYPPLSAIIKKKKIFGRGATDMKGGLAAMVIALKVLKKLDLELSGNLIIASVADEETGGIFGTKWLLENKMTNIKCDFIIVGEPTGLKPLPKAILLGEKGRVVIKIITNGISCHASTPFIGKNAIYMMSDIIQNLDNLDEYIPKTEPPIHLSELKDLLLDIFPNREILERILTDQPLLQHILKSLTSLTKSLTMINGGIKSNVIPDRCESLIDFRLLAGQNTEMLMNALEKLVNKLGYQVKNEPAGAPEEVFVYLEIISESEASYWKNWRDSQTLKEFTEIVHKIYKKKPLYFLLPASADASFYRNSEFCQPTIIYGPGNASTAHAIDESIDIQDFINSIKVYTIFAYNFLS